MKKRQNNILKSVIFSVIVLIFLFSFQSSYSQQTIPITDPATTQVTIPAGATNIIVEVWGAGGSGGGSRKNAASGGGGGGAYSRSINGFSPGTYDVQIGQGAPAAAANVDGTAGGNTWFINASTVFADGGGGGLSDGTPGAGGNSPIGDDTTISGGNGVAGSGSQGGAGGDGANGGAGGAGGNATSGSNGSPPGGGGGGGADRSATGGAGANGQMIITYTLAATCNLSDAGLTNIQCYHNGTPSIPGDDTFTFDLNPTGTNLGATYNITGDVTQSGISYGVTNFGPYPISGGNLNITITDVDDGSCTFVEIVPAPAPCSTPPCNITDQGLTNIQCNNNGTPANPEDDTFTFDLNPIGTDLGASYTIDGGASGSYGSATTFGPYNISDGDLSITITDISTECSFGPFPVNAPATCSSDCNLESSGLTAIFCDNLTTLSDETDDTFSFKLNPTGSYLGATYSVSGDVIQSGIPYGTETTFSGFLISAGDLNITITDDATGTCQLIETVPAPNPCSLNHSSYNCTSCHITHNAPGSNLTNREFNALLCQSCHVSAGAASAMPLVNANKATPNVSGNSHSWDVPADNPTYQTDPPTNNEMAIRLPDGNIVCSTCHNQHNQGNAGNPFLRVDNTGDAMCKDCHIQRDVQRFQDGGDKGSHPVGIIYSGTGSVKTTPTGSIKTVGGKVECSSCHGVHDVLDNGTASGGLTNDGNLLRTTNDVNLCLDCHNYIGHSGYDCLDCHEVHNTVDGTIGSNIMMIRDNIDTPGGNRPVVFLNRSGPDSFVNTTGSRDGICVVCHESLSHDNYNDDILVNHDDASDKAGQTCTSCHLHNDVVTNSFTQPTGPQSCVSCHSSAQSGGRGGVPQIVGAGGEFDNSLISRHTTSTVGTDPLSQECEACHYEAAGDHPTSQMMLEDSENLNTVWSGTDTDVYCVGCHDGSSNYPSLFPDLDTDPKYNKSSYITTPHDTGDNGCMACHERHGSQYTKLTKQATNYENCFACHDGGVASTNISAVNIAIPGTSGNQHAFTGGSTTVNAGSGFYQSNAPTLPAITARLDEGNIVCSTCHDPHNDSNGKFLVNPNSGDEMCKDCHQARDLGRYTDDIVNNIGSHPVGLAYVPGGNYVDPAPTLSATQVGLKNGNIECSSCHGVHNATTTDGNLLRETMSSATCKECHDYQPHQGFDCLDCHQVHNSTNIMLLRSTVNGSPVTFSAQTGPNSFSDGDGNPNGICEVCHISTDPLGLTFHTSDVDDGVNHNDGANCTGCHPHNGYPPEPAPQVLTSFPMGSCHDCHEKTSPTDPQLFPQTGAHQVHAEKYRYACSTCHYQHGDGGALEGAHSNNSVDINFDPNGMAYRNGQDGNTPIWDSGTKTCDNIYCHSNGITAQRTEGGTPLITWTGGVPILGDVMTYQTTPAWDVTPGTGINTCYSCHNGEGNMTGDYKITALAGAVTSAVPSTYPLSGQHQKSNHQTNSQELKDSPTKADSWPGVQCFWCHNVGNKQITPTSGEDGINNYQGTYGFAGANGDIPMELHNDGETWFYPYNVSAHAEGTFVNEITGRSYPSHCGSVTCWE
ncbi:cytochrome c3 family protein [Lutimonas vermicola]|uniref:CxxxxCH/CxxCH domain-containing protein n=1 Tax=Lutimonas vermicola TaxID=414288 RepID=A0ABU9KZX2_9FLAO